MKDESLRDTMYLFVGCWAIPKVDIQHVVYLANMVLKQTLNQFINFRADNL